MKKSIYTIQQLIRIDHNLWPGPEKIRFITSFQEAIDTGKAQEWDDFKVIPVCFCFLYRKAILSDLRRFRIKRAWRRSVSGLIRYIQDLKGSG